MVKNEQVREVMRRVRESVCFPVINRGPLWYETLTEAQRAELKEWYTAWLDVTETGKIPRMPTWLQRMIE